MSARKRPPPEVDNLEGWSPFAAREFLAGEGLRTNDYHPSGDGEEWWSGVAARDLNEGILPSIGNYSFSGIEGVAKQLKFRGHFVDQYVTDEAQSEFSRLAAKLCDKALNGDITALRERLAQRVPFEMRFNETTVSLAHERFPNDKGYELTMLFRR